MAELVYLDLGRAAYQESLQRQHLLWRRVVASEKNLAYLVLVEHDPPVITLGRRARSENVLASPEQLQAAGIELQETDRGGDVTYHGPGQITGYPILRVDRCGRGIRPYLRNLEEVLIRVAGDFGVDCHREEGLTGVWAGQEKLAAIGVTVRKWVSYHGFALNVCPDLTHFAWIVPCGITDRAVTSLQKFLGRPVHPDQVKPLLVQRFAEVFGFETVVASPPEDCLAS